MMYRPAGVPVSLNLNVAEDYETVVLESAQARGETFFKLACTFRGFAAVEKKPVDGQRH